MKRATTCGKKKQETQKVLFNSLVINESEYPFIMSTKGGYGRKRVQWKQMGNDVFIILKQNEVIGRAWKELFVTKERQNLRSHVSGSSTMTKQHY
jgi:hypothetical protein